jgi:protoporphyrinogen oxidase
MRGLPKGLTARILADYARESLAGWFKKTPDDTFEAWGVKRFGRTLYELCFGQYTERVWGMPPSQISARLGSQKLARLSLRDILLKLLGGRGEEQSTYWVDFFYPERGSGVLFEALRDAVIQAGGIIHLSAPVRTVRASERKGVEILADGPGGPIGVRADWVISTIPVGALAKAIDPPLDAAARQAADRLRFRGLVLVNLALDIPQAMPQHWVYLLDPKFRFNRVAEQKNLGKLCAPADRTALAFELCCNEGDEVWRSPDEALYEAAIAEARKTGLFPNTPIRGLCVLRLREAYPIYDLGLDQNLEAVFGALRGIPNLVSLGREGLFLNCDIHDAMLMGLEGAEFAMSRPTLPAAWYDRMGALVAERTGGSRGQATG